MRHPSARALHAYWDRLRRGRPAPERSEIEPGQIGRMLGDIVLLEGGGFERFKVRLAGTRLCALLGKEVRGKSFVSLFARTDRAALLALLDETASEAVPGIAAVIGETEQGQSIEMELLLLPLRHRGDSHARMLGILAPLEVPYWVGSHPLGELRIRSLRLHREDGEATLAPSAPRPARAHLRLVHSGTD
ncbi:MAG TPA: PAS domain-containing protein [Xanthobacteraceae bacterium]|mgnify:CR=1 FL=1|nr:PAS domain-containing protein [Xanthobacteraceae bacterium]